MKHKILLSLGALLTALSINSCASNGGGSYSGATASRDYAPAAKSLAERPGLVEWGVKGDFGFLPTYKEGGYRRRLVAGQKGAPIRSL